MDIATARIALTRFFTIVYNAQSANVIAVKGERERPGKQRSTANWRAVVWEGYLKAEENRRYVV